MHLTDTLDPRKGMWCAIDGFSLKSILQQAGITAKTPFIPPEAFEATLNELNILYSMRDCNDTGADLRRAGSVYNILGALLKSSGTSSKNAWIQKAIGIMEARYNEEISIEDIAKETGLERTYFSTLFKSTTGLSHNAFLTQLRIRKASALLKESSATVTEISTSVGLDPQNFSRFFKRATGMTPKEYAKKFSQTQNIPSKQ